MKTFEQLFKILLGFALLLISMLVAEDLICYMTGSDFVNLFAPNINRVFVDLFIFFPTVIGAFYFLTKKEK